MQRWLMFTGSLIVACSDGAPSHAGRDGGADATPTARDGAGDASPAACMAAAEGVAIHAADLDDEDGYAPYAVDGCALVYVAAGAGGRSGDLVLRRLDTGEEERLASGAAKPRRPAIAGDVIAWEEESAAGPFVRVRVDGQVITPSLDFVAAAEPRAAEDVVVFTGFLEGLDTDVYLYDVSTASVQKIAGGWGQQRFADVSTTHVAISDFSEDTAGVYDPLGQADADLLIYDRRTGQTERRSIEGKQAYPMLGLLDHVAYLEWTEERPMPKLAGYTIRSVRLDDLREPGAFIGKVGTDPPAIRPAARGDRVEWVEYTDGQAAFYRSGAETTASPFRVEGLEGALFAPQAAEEFTVLAATRLDDVPRLVALEP